MEMKKDELKKGTGFIPQVVYAAARKALLRNTEKYSFLVTLRPCKRIDLAKEVLESNQAPLCFLFD